MTIFTKITMNFRKRGKAIYVIFTLPQLIIVELRWIGNSSKAHSLGLENRVDWTFKKIL